MSKTSRNGFRLTQLFKDPEVKTNFDAYWKEELTKASHSKGV